MIESNFIKINSQFYGLVSFDQGNSIQEQLLPQLKDQKAIHLCGFEIEPVITLGIRGKLAEDITDSQVSLPIVATDRGGQATIHSPGQLVIYPIADIKAIGYSVKSYVELLLESARNVFELYNLKSRVDTCNPGLYTEQGKIAFVGIKLVNGVVKHGISINLNNDLNYFDSIRSCGFSKAQLDRLCDHVGVVDSQEFFQSYVNAFADALLQVNSTPRTSCDSDLQDKI